MNKKYLSVISFILIICMLAVCVPFSAYAGAAEHFTCVESGTQAIAAFNWFVPQSAWKTTTGVCCTNDQKVAQPYTVQLRELYVGAEAQALVALEDKYASAPTASQQWMVFKYNVKNNSTLPIDVSDMMWASYGHYTADGTEIDVAEVSYFDSAARKCFARVPDIAPGQSADVWNAILIDKSAGFPIIQVPQTVTAGGSQQWSYLYTTPSTSGVAAPKPPTKEQIYNAVFAILKSNGGSYSAASDTSHSKAVFSLTADLNTGAIVLGVDFDDKGATAADGNIRVTVGKNFAGSYPFVMTGIYVDVGKVMSIKGTVPSRLDGNYNFHSYVGTDEFHRNDLMESAHTFVETALKMLYTFAIENVNKDLYASHLGLDSKFFCPTGHSPESFRYNNDATATKDGTKTAICYDCGERFTISALGTKTSATQIKNSAAVFKDVQVGKWYKNAIDYAYSNSFISGMSPNSFGLQTSITRGMFVTILARIAGVDTSTAANAAVTTKFTDVARGRFYTNAVKWGYENGIVSGLSDTAFGPTNNITREQLCVMIVNFAKTYEVDIQGANPEIKFADSRNIAGWSYVAVTKCQKAGIVSGYNEGGQTYFKPKNTATRAEAAQILYKFHNDFVVNK